MLPPVWVTRRGGPKTNKGIDEYDQTKTMIPSLEAWTFPELCETEFEYDAHLFVCAPRYPDRLAGKDAISGRQLTWRWRKHPADVMQRLANDKNPLVGSYLIFDLDRLDHSTTWADLDEAGEALEVLEEIWPRELSPHCIYMTRGGARVVFRLDTPLECRKLELARQVIEPRVTSIVHAANLGIEVDHKTKSWPHPFRVPRATRGVE